MTGSIVVKLKCRFYSIVFSIYIAVQHVSCWRFTHKCSLLKRALTRFADRSVPKMLDIFYCGSTVKAVCICYMRFQRIIHSICANFAPLKLLFFRRYTIPCAHQWKRRACFWVKKRRACVWVKKRRACVWMTWRRFAN